MPVEEIRPVPPIMWDLGMSLGIFSYAGETYFGVTADQNLVQPWEIVDAMFDSFAELATAAGLSQGCDGRPEFEDAAIARASTPIGLRGPAVRNRIRLRHGNHA